MHILVPVMVLLIPVIVIMFIGSLVRALSRRDWDDAIEAAAGLWAYLGMPTMFIATWYISDHSPIDPLFLFFLAVAGWLAPFFWLSHGVGPQEPRRAVPLPPSPSPQEGRARQLRASLRSRDPRAREPFRRSVAVDSLLNDHEIDEAHGQRLEALMDDDTRWASAWMEATGEAWEFICDVEHEVAGPTASALREFLGQISPDGTPAEGPVFHKPSFGSARDYELHIAEHLTCSACAVQYADVEAFLDHLLTTGHLLDISHGSG